jgi:hypothetical protein
MPTRSSFAGGSIAIALLIPREITTRGDESFGTLSLGKREAAVWFLPFADLTRWECKTPRGDPLGVLHQLTVLRNCHPKCQCPDPNTLRTGFRDSLARNLCMGNGLEKFGSCSWLSLAEEQDSNGNVIQRTPHPSLRRRHQRRTVRSASLPTWRSESRGRQ